MSGSVNGLSNNVSTISSQISSFEFRIDPTTGDPQYRKSGADTWNFFRSYLSPEALDVDKNSIAVSSVGNAVQNFSYPNKNFRNVLYFYNPFNNANYYFVQIYDFRKGIFSTVGKNHSNGAVIQANEQIDFLLSSGRNGIYAQQLFNINYTSTDLSFSIQNTQQGYSCVYCLVPC